MIQENSNLFLRVYERLYAHYGSQGWWPGDTPLEMMVGAVLTQNTNWKNVEKALVNLKENDQLSFSALLTIEQNQLAEYIRPSGYYNIKARRLKNLFQMIEEKYEGVLEFFFEDSLEESRDNLLKVKRCGARNSRCHSTLCS